MRAERRPGNERPEQEGAHAKSKEGEVLGLGEGCYIAEAQKQEAQLAGEG